MQCVHKGRGHRTSRIQLCLSLLTLVMPLAMESKSQPSHSAHKPQQGLVPACVPRLISCLAPPPWPSHCGFVEFLSILRTVPSPVPSGPLGLEQGLEHPSPNLFTTLTPITGQASVSTLHFQSFWPTSLSGVEQTPVRRHQGLRCDGD